MSLPRRPSRCTSSTAAAYNRRLTSRLKPAPTSAKEEIMAITRPAIAGLVLGFVVACQPPLAAQGGNGAQWVTTWHTAVVPRAAMPPQQGQGQPPLNFNNQTLRQIVHVSLGGDRI